MPHRPTAWRRTRPLPAFLLSTLLCSGAAAAAQPAAYTPGEVVRLSYEGYAHGLHVLTVDGALRLTDTGYSVRMSYRTAGLISMVSHTRISSSSEGRFDGGKPEPLDFTSEGYTRGADRSVRLSFKDGMPQVDALSPPEPNRDPVPASQLGGSIDSLTAMATLIHEVSASGRCDGHAKLFDGLRLTALDAHTTGSEAVPHDDRSPFGGDALRCDFTGQQIGGFLHDKDAAPRKPRAGTAWVASAVPGAPKLPVRVVFDHPKLGLITLVLTKASIGG
jgi:hypothetical protein